MAKKAIQQDPLEALVNAPLDRVLALVLWRIRHQNPTMALVLKAEDIQGLEDCCAYHKVQPAVAIVRPAGRPATPAIPPRGNRPGQPAMPAEAPRPHVVVALVAKGTMDAIRPLENNDEDTERLVGANERRRWREKAPMLAGQARGIGSGGDVSLAVMNEIADCLQALAVE